MLFLLGTTSKKISYTTEDAWMSCIIKYLLWCNCVVEERVKWWFEVNWLVSNEPTSSTLFPVIELLGETL